MGSSEVVHFLFLFSLPVTSIAFWLLMGEALKRGKMIIANQIYLVFHSEKQSCSVKELRSSYALYILIVKNVD